MSAHGTEPSFGSETFLSKNALEWSSASRSNKTPIVAHKAI